MSPIQPFASPNRPDALGFWNDSQASKQSKYVDAMRRVVESLKAKAAPISPEDVRGKRRTKKKPQDASHTIRAYLKALETFSYWMQAEYGYELDPVQVTREVCFKFAQWLGSDEPPNIIGLRVKGSGDTYYNVFEAVRKANAIYGEDTGVREVYEHLPPRETAELAPKDGSFKTLHRILGEITKGHKAIVRSPSTKELRAKMGTIWSSVERDPLTYRYSVRPKKAYKPSSVLTTLSALSAIWEALLEGDNTPGGEAPLQFNPWKGARGPIAVAKARNKEAMRRDEIKPMISHAIVDAMLDATDGPSLEARRDKSAILSLLYTGIRAEELVGLLRRDLVDADGVLSLRVIGKGDKQRIVPIFSEVRDSYAQLDAALEHLAANGSSDEDSQYRAEYAQTLLDSKNAPLIPSLPRWGANAREVAAEDAAMEPLYPSGLAAILKKVANKATVYDKRIRRTRELSPDEKDLVHPHAFRHYAATAAQEAGLPLIDIKRLMGHEDSKTTERYIKVAPVSMSQFGAYIAKSRSGTVMTPEEAAQIKSEQASVLHDPHLVAAPSKEKLDVIEKKKRSRGVEPAEEETVVVEEQRELIASPKWAYTPGSEKLQMYLPPDVVAQKVPKGKGFLLTFRIGTKSLLPWWAGRANRWKQSQMAPVISFYQAFAERDDVNIRDDLSDLFYDVLEQHGITAASAYAEWVREIVGFASVRFFTTMAARGDSWTDFDQPALSGQSGLVRMHDNARILKWFKENALSAAASVLRAPPQWDAWPGNISEPTSVDIIQISPPVYRTVFNVQKVADFQEFFKPTPTTKAEDLPYKGGTGKGLRRIRYKSPGGEWQHAVIIEQKGNEVTILGSPMPDTISKLEVSSIEKIRVAEEYHPVITSMKDLPVWFFEQDPLLSLPEDERAKMREWVENLQGTKKSRMRAISSAHFLATEIQTWWDMSKELASMSKVGGSEDRAEALQRDANELEETIRETSLVQFGVEIDPKVIVGSSGKKVDEEYSKARSKIYERPEAFLEKQLLEQGEDVEKRLQMKLPPLERRIFAYVELKTGKPYDKKGIKLEPIVTDTTGIFGTDNIRWNAQNTIEHTRAFKETFFKARGTDSECVVRRALRSLWERKKAHDEAWREKQNPLEIEFGKPPKIHRDIITRHMNSLIAYLVPCPKQLERDLKEMFMRAVSMRSYEEIPVPFRGIISVEGRPPVDLTEQILPEQIREMWGQMVEEGETRRFQTPSEDRAEEIRQMFAGLEEFSEGEETPEFARRNSKLAGLVRELLNPVTATLAEFWPV